MKLPFTYVFCAATLAFMLTGITQAATIITIPTAVDNNSPEARVEDSDNNGTGDSTKADADDPVLVGDSSTTNKVFGGVWHFDISSNTAEISNAASIVFKITLDRISGDPEGTYDNFHFEALTANEDGKVSSSDYNTAADFVTLIDAATPAGTVIEVDVTSFVKSDSQAAQQFSAFRMMVPDPPNGWTAGGADVWWFENEPDGNGGVETFTDARLEITPIPEPATLALTALGLCLIRRRQR